MPRWKELKRFCDRDGWECYKDTDAVVSLDADHIYLITAYIPSPDEWEPDMKTRRNKDI